MFKLYFSTLHCTALSRKSPTTYTSEIRTLQFGHSVDSSIFIAN